MGKRMGDLNKCYAYETRTTEYSNYKGLETALAWYDLKLDGRLTKRTRHI